MIALARISAQTHSATRKDLLGKKLRSGDFTINLTFNQLFNNFIE
jgi:hypothetical protein